MKILLTFMISSESGLPSLMAPLLIFYISLFICESFHLIMIFGYDWNAKRLRQHFAAVMNRIFDCNKLIQFTLIIL